MFALFRPIYDFLIFFKNSKLIYVGYVGYLFFFYMSTQEGVEGGLCWLLIMCQAIELTYDQPIY